MPYNTKIIHTVGGNAPAGAGVNGAVDFEPNAAPLLDIGGALVV